MKKYVFINDTNRQVQRQQSTQQKNAKITGKKRKTIELLRQEKLAINTKAKCKNI